MKQNKKDIFNTQLQSLDQDRKHAPKGFLQPLYDLIGCRVSIHSNTLAGRKGSEFLVDSVSQDYNERLGRMLLTLKFATGSNLSIPIPSTIELSEDGQDLYLSFERRDPKADEASPYRHMRKNVNGYTINKEDGFSEVLITILEKPQANV